MSNSPYIPPEVKQYMKRFKVEELIQDSVNQLLSEQKDDPYAFLMSYFSKLASQQITIVDIDSYEILNSEGVPTLQFIFSLKYKDQIITVKPIIHFNLNIEQQQIFTDGDQARYSGLGLQKAQHIIKENISPILKNRQPTDQKGIDESLQKYLTQNPTHINLIQPISFALNSLISQVLNKDLFSTLGQVFANQEITIPKLFVNLLQGSKVVASKCKVYRYQLVIHEQKDPFLITQISQTIVGNLRKSIVSGKSGEAALKFYQDGTFLCTADTIADNLKLVEAAIETSGFKDKVGVGIVWLADLFYNPDQKKYELENPKQLLDTDQLIDYYFKLCTDRPCNSNNLLIFKKVICYMEDPIQSEDVVGWQKILNRFQTTKVKIGSRKLYSTLDNARKLTQEYTKEVFPNLSDEELKLKNSQRIQLDYFNLRMYTFPTFTQFLALAKFINQKKPQTTLIIQDSLTDTQDSQIVDLCCAMKNVGLNIGGPSKFEKLLKYSRLIEISQFQHQ